MQTFTLVLITFFGGDYHEMRVDHIPTFEACQIIQKFYTAQYNIEQHDRSSVICIPVVEQPAINIREIK